MTTTASSARGSRDRTFRVLVAAGLVVAVAVLLLAGVAALLSGRPAAYGALTGGGIALSFFVVGSGIVMGATRLAPQTALMVALLTYTLQVALVALAFAALVSSGALDSTLSAGWLAGGVATATVVWTVAQLWGTARLRIPAYDLGASSPRVRKHDETGTFPGPVQRREAGAS